MQHFRYSTLLGTTLFFSLIIGCSKDDSQINDQLDNRSINENIVSSNENIAADVYQEMNDSGITWAGNYPKDNSETCNNSFEVESTLPESKNHLLIQQDCSVGRDVNGGDSDVKAGFSYQKIDSEGKALPGDSRSGSCVLDTVTGLLWEIKTGTDGIYGNDGLHDGDDVFTWYSNNSSVNGGSIGDWSDKLNVCSGYLPGQPATFCNTEEFIQRVNNVGICGFKDWRLPTRFELESLLNYGNKAPTIDITYFPNTMPEFYWSATPAANNQHSAWVVNFRTSNTSMSSRESSFPVRLVRDWASK